ncbi:MAG: protein kinase [Oscillatoria princeps RMCB-10]|jgi:tetratricopeptide (TPR) repeat protein|nr:protein kinase [Oscillatoria princeps RMCB-10]
MSYCCNPKCPKPDDPLNAGQLICCNCGSELLLQNRYRVVQLLGEGGFGKTFEVDDAGTRKVLKVLRKNYPKAVYLFQREAEVLKQLRHPGIPRVEADGYFTWLSGSGEPVYCLVMEKIDGQDLEKWLTDNQPITQERAIDWLKQLLEILDKLHRQQYFHRDINPRNIMQDRQGQLVLIDFGAVREITRTYLVRIVGEQEGTKIGSAGYMPLEQVDGQAMPQSDFFALGRTFVYLLTGKSPLDFSKNPDTGKLIWNDSAPQISPQLADLIDDLMAPFPGLRPTNAQVILQRLQAVETGLPVGGQNSVPVAASGQTGIDPPNPQRNTASRLKSIRVKIGVAGLLLLGFTGLRLASPQIAVALNRQGLQDYKAKQLDFAEIHYRFALALDPNNVDAHYNLGLVYDRRLDYERARAQYQIARQRKPNYVQAYNNLARLDILHQKYDTAISTLQKGLELIKDQPNTETLRYALLKNLGWAHLERGHYNQAEIHLQEAIKHDGGTRFSAHCLLAQALETRKDSKGALAKWETCYNYAQQNAAMPTPEEEKWTAQAKQRLQPRGAAQ